MATTKIEIASQALGLLRANPISSFDDGSNEADIITLYYDTFIRDIFSRYPWHFATKTRRLVIAGDEVPLLNYKYAFILPAECKRLIAVYADEGNFVRPFQDYIQEGSYLLTNSDKLYAKYTAYVDENLWPGYFTAYAIHALAALIAIPLTDDPDIEAREQTLAYGTSSEGERGGKFQSAILTDAQQSPPDEMDTDLLIAARFG